MALFDAPNAAFAALESRVAALEAAVGVTPEPDPELTWTTRTADLLIRTGDTVEYTRWTGPGPASSLIGMYGTGINGATLRHLEMTGCAYGAKFGGGAVSRNLACSDWVSRNCDQGLYLGCVEDSTFDALHIDCPTVKSQGYSNHCIYVERACKRLTFRDLFLTGAWGYALQVYMDSTAAADRCSDLRFETVTFGSPEAPCCPVVIMRADRVVLRHVHGWADDSEPAIKLASCNDVLLEDVHMVGGDGFLSQTGCTNVRTVGCTWNGAPA